MCPCSTCSCPWRWLRADVETSRFACVHWKEEERSFQLSKKTRWPKVAIYLLSNHLITLRTRPKTLRFKDFTETKHDKQTCHLVEGSGWHYTGTAFDPRYWRKWSNSEDVIGRQSWKMSPWPTTPWVVVWEFPWNSLASVSLIEPNFGKVSLCWAKCLISCRPVAVLARSIMSVNASRTTSGHLACALPHRFEPRSCE